MSKRFQNTGSFQVRDGKLLLYRVGPANGRKQRHNACARNIVTGEKEPERETVSHRKTPFPRGYWAFPFPFHEAFFYYHVYSRQLPKRLQEHDNWTSEEIAEHEIIIKAIRKRTRPKLIWYGGPFFSHVKPAYVPIKQDWYRYDNAREWIDAARGELWTWIRSGELFRTAYARDHLEIFVPA